jgi:uncharacterized membrane protein YecN with MAPEG domain
MTLFQIAALYIALNLILTPILMYRVGQVRLGKKIDLGDGGDALMFSRIRAHGNFIENAPLALIGLIGLAMLSAPALAIHVFGAAFFIGRILHAMGMAGSFGKGRLIGTILTLLTHFGQAGFILFLIFTG